MLERSGRAALPADVELDRLGADQGHVFNEQAQNPLAFARRRARIVPYSWQIRDQRMNAVPRLLTEPRILVFHCARILLLGLGESASLSFHRRSRLSATSRFSGLTSMN